MANATRLEGTRIADTPVPSVDRALDLLELLAHSNHGLRLSELSRKLRIPKSSMHYLIRALAQRGYLERDPNGRGYLLGMRAASFANTTTIKLKLKTLCGPHLRKLTEKIGVTASVGVLDGAEGLVIDLQTPTDIRYDSWIGRHFDLHCSALGKALIAHFSDIEVERLFEGRGLPKHTPNTVCSMEALKGDLIEVRTRGFATNDQELDIGIRCAGAPIFNSLGRVVAAVSVGSSANKVASWQIPRLGEEILGVAKEISRDLCDSSLLPGKDLLHLLHAR